MSLRLRMIPILDSFWVISRRIFVEKRSPFTGDTNHFHHRLLRLGLSEKTVVFLIWGFSALFGGIALTLQGAEKKLLAILVMTGLLFLIALIIGIAEWRKGKN